MLHFLNDVPRLNLALESTQGILQRLALLQSNLRQNHHPQTRINRTRRAYPTVPINWLQRFSNMFDSPLSRWIALLFCSDMNEVVQLVIESKEGIVRGAAQAEC